jgi:hypothetical protein
MVCRYAIHTQPQEGSMRSCTLLFLAVATIVISGTANGQQSGAARTPDPAHYSVQRESDLVGTVVAFEANSKTAPFGARVTLQTSGSVVEVHLGDARLLSANHFTIHTGDALRIVGEPISVQGAQFFVARIVQKGTQALAVRTARGLLVPYVAPRATNPNNAVKGAA